MIRTHDERAHGRRALGFSIAMLLTAIAPASAAQEEPADSASQPGQAQQTEESAPELGDPDGDIGVKKKPAKPSPLPTAYPVAPTSPDAEQATRVSHELASQYPSYEATSPSGRPELADTPTRERRPYTEGRPVPEGYYVEESPRMGLVISGATTTLALWAASATAAFFLDQEADAPDGDPNFNDRYWPMFIPVAGPFITIGTADSSGTGAALLGLDGAFQTVGLGLFIAGFAAPKMELVPDESDLAIAPRAGQDSAGLDLSGSF